MKTISFLFLLLCISNAVAQKSKNKETTSSRPFVLGNIDVLPSKVLGEDRILNIYLPEGYQSNDTTHYPVVYLLDGSADEDFIHVAGLMQFCNFPWINRWPKSIVVGIASVDRERDFTLPNHIEAQKSRFPSAGQSDKFIAFIENELKVYMKTNYRTTAETTLVGQSLGGLLATEILLMHPDMFDQYIIVSPSLWWNNAEFLTMESPLLAADYQKKKKIYIGVGKEGLTPFDPPRVMEVDANLLADRILQTKKENLEVHFDYLPQENHATVLHQALSQAFQLLYQPELEVEH